MLDHLSIQCADLHASAAFYDAVLGPLGGTRVIDFGEVIGSGAAGKPEFWMGPQASGEGFRESHIAFAAPDRAASGRSFRRRPASAPRCCTNPACGRNTTPAIMQRSCVTPTATTSRPCATRPNNPRPARAWLRSHPHTRAAASPPPCRATAGPSLHPPAITVMALSRPLIAGDLRQAGQILHRQRRSGGAHRASARRSVQPHSITA